MRPGVYSLVTFLLFTLYNVNSQTTQDLCASNSFRFILPGMVDLTAASTLTELQSYQIYADCPYTFTWEGYVTIGTISYQANPVTFAFPTPSQYVVLTYTYPDVTLTTLTVGENLTFSHTATATAAGFTPVTMDESYTAQVPTQNASLYQDYCQITACNPFYNTYLLCSDSNPSISSATDYVPFLSCFCSQSISFFSVLSECSSCAQAIGDQEFVSELQINAEVCNPGAPQTATTSSGTQTINVFPTATTRTSPAVASATAKSAAARVEAPEYSFAFIVLVSLLMGLHL